MSAEKKDLVQTRKILVKFIIFLFSRTVFIWVEFSERHQKSSRELVKGRVLLFIKLNINRSSNGLVKE